MKKLLPMRTALEHPDIFGRVLDGPSWDAWRALLIAIVGEELTEAEREIYTEVTGREREPGAPVEEFWGIVGRRGGKSRAIAVLGAYIGALVDIADLLAPGERASLPIMSASLWQAGKIRQYVDGLFANVPVLRKLVTGQTADTISLSTLVDIEVRPASFRTIRGGTMAGIVCDEICFWRSDQTVNPDSEVLNAARPGVATTGGMLVAISSPYGKRGEAYQAFRRHYGPDGDPKVLVAKAASRVMNPSLSESVVRRAYERDASVASAEYGGEFRNDLEDFVSREIVEQAVAPSRHELPPISSVRYFAFADPSGGTSDSFTMAICHLEGEKLVLDVTREMRPPFSPEAVVDELATCLKTYRVSSVHGDRYAGEFPRELFRKRGIEYRLSERTKSQIYSEFLPLLNSGRVELLDSPRLVGQLCALERRTSRGGRDTIDHPPNAHDDLANAVAGALVLAGQRDTRPQAVSIPFEWR